RPLSIYPVSSRLPPFQYNQGLCRLHTHTCHGILQSPGGGVHCTRWIEFLKRLDRTLPHIWICVSGCSFDNRCSFHGAELTQPLYSYSFFEGICCSLGK